MVVSKRQIVSDYVPMWGFEVTGQRPAEQVRQKFCQNRSHHATVSDTSAALHFSETTMAHKSCRLAAMATASIFPGGNHLAALPPPSMHHGTTPEKLQKAASTGQSAVRSMMMGQRPG